MSDGFINVVVSPEKSGKGVNSAAMPLTAFVAAVRAFTASSNSLSRYESFTDVMVFKNGCCADITVRS
jgi:hypothetical protein